MTPIGKPYIDAILRLSEKLNEQSPRWAIGGDLGEALQSVDAEPDRIEIVTDRQSIRKIHDAVAEYEPSQAVLREAESPNVAVIGGKIYPVYTRCRYFSFSVGEVRVEVHGDLQYSFGIYDWGEPLAVEPEYVYLIGARIPVLSLKVKDDLYKELGWLDRSEKLSRSLATAKKKAQALQALGTPG